ncbi:2-oxo-4-hydroxy-4-carboxy-5-ureidoimidazoline decarboxylase [Luteolibacter pohnpeiensis]|uniref:2-oxo-4-hydroxy-4-carboxy-5-ureidoimidazoline decarboxylase n=1 Tax=Luteolibacter pohnpeiensis TaxID=454153 RepID=A0A934S1X4_9BACT|nr:2-oxo-4-hydroxy-4-carboxy-5-ureidoimidazoline decarboxylase [Luteolibacter pohnpeiensis]MBK1880886.1 2-oxo-4-hydroxy-4-carboxy-5-ureidoimidazoline decarboxylase [Luteolibacter pohnpeiensis]
MKISELNALGEDEFVALLGGIYEHSPWVAERLSSGRPFERIEQIADQMQLAVNQAERAAQLTLIRAHPDLGGKLAVSGNLTQASMREQSGAGLDRLTPEEFHEFSELNRRYREKFSFPFIICVRKTDKTGILAAFRQRLLHSAEEEQQAAIAEIHEIARLRLQDLLTPG